MMAREHEEAGEPETTGVSTATIELIGDASVNKPDGFAIHPKLQALLEKRREMSRSGSVDWAFAEVLALGSLLAEGTPVRMAGQDTRRGTFAQRHAVLHDRATGNEWSPLAGLTPDQATFSVYDSLLSEYAALAFEYGYSAERADALVLWEAQFGDFVNGAQIVIDEFVSSARQKWGQRSGVVLLLPHGYEGQGPDHSSARIERFLQLCAEENMTVAQPSSPASYFHLLRRQAHARPRRPLVVVTPKSMLRMRAATSGLDEFTNGRFEPILDDGRSGDTGTVRRVVLVSGKLYYDLLARLARQPDPGVAILRIEQLYPLPTDELNRRLEAYPGAELVWAQEEPKNRGHGPSCSPSSRQAWIGRSGWSLDLPRPLPRPAQASDTQASRRTSSSASCREIPVARTATARSGRLSRSRRAGRRSVARRQHLRPATSLTGRDGGVLNLRRRHRSLDQEVDRRADRRHHCGNAPVDGPSSAGRRSKSPTCSIPKEWVQPWWSPDDFDAYLGCRPRGPARVRGGRWRGWRSSRRRCR